MRVASIQMETGDRGKKENLARAETLISRARGADLILLPEVWNIGYFSFDRYEAESEDLNGETAGRMSDAARRSGAYLFAGSWIVREGGRFFNASFLFDREGKVAGVYRKIHLFGYGSRERQLLTAGDGVVTVETEIATFGLTTCYDLRFPELYRKMTARGAEIFLVASAWPYPRLEHWMLFNRVRALENLTFLVSANCVGINNGTRCCGHSMVVDPWGIPVSSGGDEEDIVTADIELERVDRVRKEFPALQDIVFPAEP